jgi:hypothetical protein
VTARRQHRIGPFTPRPRLFGSHQKLLLAVQNTRGRPSGRNASPACRYALGDQCRGRRRAPVEALAHRCEGPTAELERVQFSLGSSRTLWRDLSVYGTVKGNARV